MLLHASRDGLRMYHRVVALRTLLISVALVISMPQSGAWADEPPGTGVPSGDVVDDRAVRDEVLERPDGVSAAVTARLKGKPVEDLSKRTESSRTLVNPDGTLTDEISAGPVRVRDEATGEWADVDDTFVKQPDGTYAPKASPTDVVISAGGSTTAATVKLEDGNSLAVTWPEQLSAPTVEGGVATFKVSESADLLLVMTGSGVAVRVRLNQRPAAGEAAVDLGLVTRGLKVAEVAAGDATGLSFTDAQDGTKVGSVGRMVAWDARTDRFGDPVEVVPVEAGLSKPVVDGKSRRHELTLRAAEDFLDDPKTRYPVIVDPDVSAVGITADTWIRSGTTTAQGADHRLMVGRLADSSNTNHIVSLIIWNQATLSSKNILAATAGFYQYGAGSCSPRQVNLHPVTGAWSEASTVWTNRPSMDTTLGVSTSFTTNRGGTGCTGTAGTNGFVTVNLLKMVQAWANGTISNRGVWINVPSGSTNDVSYERRFCSRQYDATYTHCKDATRRPYLSIRYNGPPGAAAVPTPTTGSRTTDGVLVSSTNKPSWSTVATDPESSPLTYSIEVRTSVSATTNVATCTTAQVASGTKASCTPGTALVNGATYVVRARAVDHNGVELVGPYSAWRTFKVNTTAPAITGVSCSNGYTPGNWYDPRGAATTECTISTTGAYDVQWKVNGSAVKTTKVAGGAVSTGTISIPQDGYTKIEAQAFSTAGLSTGWKAYGFGTGTSTLLQPQKDDRSTSTFPVEAGAPPGAASAEIKWRYAPKTQGDSMTGWTKATNLVVAETGAAWTGTVTSNGELSTSGSLIWDASAETGIDKPALVEVRVEFSYPGGTIKPSPLQRVHVVPHAFGGSFPTQEFGPGEAALFTGEFQISETDVEVEGYGSNLSLGRSHLSLAGQPAGPAGVFGPGWVADLAGPEEGLAGFVVVDRRSEDGTIQLTDPEGETYVYLHEKKKSGAGLTGTFTGIGETALDEHTLKVDAVAGEAGIDQRLVLREWDGTKTIWVRVASTKVWVVEQVGAPEVTATTTYAHHEDGTVSWIFAPAPAGVECNVAVQARGCRALRLIYTGSGASKRLVEVRLRAWDPKPASDGLPGAGAGMAEVPVQRYAYNSAGQLSASWDPRIADGEAALETTYTYADTSERPKLASLTEPGLKPWQFTYAADGEDAGKIITVSRDQDPEVGGTATWEVDYNLALNAGGDGLPNVSEAATTAWGQPVADSPVGGTAVYGPDAQGAGAVRNEYASLSYYTRAGRTTNTAAFGAGAWQIDTTRYDPNGNIIWALSPEGRRLALAEGADDFAETAGAAEKYATHTVYNADITDNSGEVVVVPAGTRVEQIWGPTRDLVLEDGTRTVGRTLTENVYDDEADASLMPGRPTEDVPEGGFGVAVEIRVSVTTKPSPGSDGEIHDTTLTRFRFDKIADADGDGWVFRSPSRTLTQNRSKSAGWDTAIHRFDTEGKTIQTRTPEGVESGQQTRWTNTVYYTHDASASRAECRNRPEWVGVVCWTGPAAQPEAPGLPIPTESTPGYSMLLHPTRVVVTAGAATRTKVTDFDGAGRRTKASTTLTGLSGRPVFPTVTTYDPTKGLVASVTNGESTQTTTYDSWGRVIERSDGNGHTSTTAYDTAGRVVEAYDGLATTTYTYNGNDSRGRRERRGLVTRLDTSMAGGNAVFTGAYDAAGNLVHQTYPGNVSATATYDLSGARRSILYTIGEEDQLAFSAEVDAQSRIRFQTEASGSAQEYRYDDRDRLVEARDTRDDACTVRTYGFSADSNRTSLATHAPDPAGDCQTATAASNVDTAFDSADRLKNTGDVYDDLGRTLTVPAASTDTPDDGDVTIGYHADDMVATLTQGSRSQDFTLDAAGRLARQTSSVNGVVVGVVANAYSGSGDSPAWTETKSRPDASSAWVTLTQRYVSGISGNLALIEPSDGPVSVQLANLHDDVVATVDITGDQAGTLTSYTDYTEYGTPVTPAATPGRYGWLGAKARQGIGIIGGLSLMGVRLYNPATGRFLSRDPVPGGNDNTYTYPADPVNKRDLTGRSNTRDTGGAGYGGGYSGPGIYIFTARSGRKYVGSSVNVSRRLGEHVRKGRVAKWDAERAQVYKMRGSTRVQRRYREQQEINRRGGIKNLDNKVNAMSDTKFRNFPIN